MGQFAGTLFRLLLGWVQTAVSWLWNLAANADVSAGLHWLLDHWLMLLALLCIGGVLVDFLVYLLRWQPYRVWRSFLQRLKGKAEEASETTPEQPVSVRRWVYADGSTQVEEISEGGFQSNLPEEYLNAPIRPTRRMARRASQEKAYNQPVYPPQWQHNTQLEQGENE